MHAYDGAPPPAAEDRPSIPDYELLRVIGRGSYGDVWLARSLTGIYRAVKVVWRSRFSDPQPFDREFKGIREFAAVSLVETRQLAVLHVGRNDASGYFYYVMELADDPVSGRAIDPARYVPHTLGELRARRGRLPAGEVIALGIELCRALDGLHSRNLVHRDLKPSNVILVAGVPKLADIGLVTAASASATFVGTEGFVPPEGPGAPAADVFGLGMLLYELATGLDRRDFPRLPSGLESLPDRRALLDLNEVVVRACDPDPSERPRDAAALGNALRALGPGGARKSVVRRIWPWAVLGTAAAVAVLVLKRRVPAPAVPPAFTASASEPSFTASAAAAKTIAVLPFENLSDDKANAFFADGIHEDILTNLTSISDLRVVSGRAVESYRGTKKGLQEIGRELSAGFILEGSVRRGGSKVRLNAQLINAQSDTQVWAKSYDRELNDIFAIQDELARNIADALQAVIDARQSDLLAVRPTDNVAAYDAFLQGIRLDQSSLGDVQSRRLQEGFFERAVSLDPKFARAWAQLAVAEASLINTAIDTSAPFQAKADAAAATALSLQPQSPEILRLEGLYASLAHRDYALAADYFQRVLNLQPNDAQAHLLLGMTYRRWGKNPEALAEMRQAVQLDPANPDAILELSNLLRDIRRYDEALAAARRLVALNPDDLSQEYYYAELQFAVTGSRDPVERFFSDLTPAQASLPEILGYRRDWALESGDFASYIRADQEDHKDHYFTGMTEAEQAWECAAVYLAMGDVEGSRRRLGGFPEELSAGLEREPQNDRMCSSLAIMEAFLGHRDRALGLMQRATEIGLGLKDDWMAYIINLKRAYFFAALQDKEATLAELKTMFTRPNYYTVHEVQVSPWYVFLHGDPRFEALVRNPKNLQPLF